MKQIARIYFILIFLLMALTPVFCQYAAQQRLIDFSITGSYTNNYDGDNYRLTTNGAFSDESYRQEFRLTNTITLEKLISDNYATGNNFFLNFSSNKNARKTIDSFDVVYERNKSNFQYFGFGAGKMFKWIYPIGKKFGCDLSTNINLFFGFGNSNSVSDSADGYNEIWDKYTNRYVSINADLNLGLYYWVSPKIILHTKIAIAKANISLNAVKRNGTNTDDTQIYYNTAIYSLFSSERALVTQSIGISFLLK